MPTVEERIEVQQPLRTVYNQWTQFEEFPQFMDGVEQVVQVDDTHLHWVAKIAGAKREWDAEIIEQTPDQRVAWRSISGTPNAGVVSFRPVSNEATEVTLKLDVEPDDAVEQAGEKLGFVHKQAEGDLKRFKEFIESRGQETGAWRGEVN